MNKKINKLTLDEINTKIEELSRHDKTFNSLHAQHLLTRKKVLLKLESSN